MKFTVLTENLNKSLQIAGKAINQRSPLPVLSNILIQTEKGRLKLTASNLQMTIVSYVGAKIDVNGEYTVPARLLMEFVSQVVDEKIEAELKESALHLETKKAKASIVGIPATEFPETQSNTTGLSVKFKSKELMEILQKELFAVAVDEGRPVLTGLYLRFEKGELTIAGTDGFRMTEYKTKVPSFKTADIVECVVPAKAIGDIVKSFSTESEELEVIIVKEKNMLVIKAEDLEAQIRLIEGQYPDYASIIPDEHTTEIRISKAEFASAIKLASIFSRDTGNMIKLVAEGKSFKAFSQPTESGSNVTEMTAEIEGEDLEIAFNARYLLDFVNNIAEDEIIFRATESQKPGLFRVEGLKGYFYLVMPMKVNW